MEERGFPGPNPEDEFTSSVEKEDSKTEKKSKRKKRFEKLLDFLLPKKSQENTDEAESFEVQSRAEKFMEASKNLFGRMLGIEREDIDEPEEDGEKYGEIEEGQPNLRIGGLFADTAPEEGPIQIVDDQKEFTKLPTDEASAVEVSEEAVDTIQNEQLLAVQREVELAYTSELPDFHQVDEQERNFAEHYEPVNRAAEHEIIDREDSSSEEKENTVIERKGGTGAALVGFVAAETLSRSRDRKIRKEAKKLSKEVEFNKKEQEAKSSALEALQRRQREEIEDLKSRREEGLNEMQAETPIQSKEAAQAYDAPNKPKQEAELNPKKLSETKHETAHERRLEPRKPEVDASEKLHLEQIEQAAENDIAIESYYEKRHEAKDVASTPVSNVAGVGVNGGLVADNEASQSSADPLYGGPANQASNHASHQMYKDAVKQGAAAGLTIVIAFVIILLIWSLL